MSVEIQNHPLDDIITPWLCDLSEECSESEKFWRRTLPSKTSAQLHILYWIHDESCKSPLTDGYIGVTTVSRKRARFLEHTGSNRFPKGFKFLELRRGSADECYLSEAALRPNANIGWNISPGGARGNKNGIPRSIETREKISKANTGNIRTDLAERNKSSATWCCCLICGKESMISYLYKDHKFCFKFSNNEPKTKT